MRLPIFKVENVRIPPEGYGFAFIDAEDKKLKIKSKLNRKFRKHKDCYDENGNLTESTFTT